MPLKIVPCRSKKTKTKNLYIRGSYLGIAVDQSTGTDRQRVAKIVKKHIEGEIERGEYRKKPSAPDRGEPTFVSAALAYLESGHRTRYVQPLVDYFQDTMLSEIDQTAIDECALALHPQTSPATRNTCVYTPLSAILHHAGRTLMIKRPPGAKGRVITDWLSRDDAFGIIAAADAFDPEFATLLTFLLYTGPRIGAALGLQRDDLDLANRTAWARPQKRQQPHAVILHEDLCDRLAALLASHKRRRVFRFHYGGHLQHLLRRAVLNYLGMPCSLRPDKGWRPPPHRLAFVTFHIWRHTWATWMRRYGGATIDDLVGSRNWRDPRSARRYVHAEPEGIWDKVEQLPGMPKRTA